MEPARKLDEGALSGPVLPNQGDDPPPRDGKAEISEGLFVDESVNVILNLFGLDSAHPAGDAPQRLACQKCQGGQPHKKQKGR